jgi:hypothetical protein
MRSPDHPKTSVTASVARRRPFANGNPGRNPGSKNRITVVAAALLDGDAEALVRKAVELAKAGDVHMLKFLLGRILPRERVVKLELPPMEFADDGVEALGRILRAVSDGTITPSEGAALATIVKSYTAAIELVDVVKRMDALEARVKGSDR